MVKNKSIFKNIFSLVKLAMASKQDKAMYFVRNVKFTVVHKIHFL